PPAMTCICKSVRMTSGCSVWLRRIASIPSLASPTTSMSAWLFKIPSIPARTTGWSSTRRTRIGFIGLLSFSRLGLSHLLNGHLNHHGGALARLTLHSQGTANLADSLSHGRQPVATALAGRQGACQTDAIILYIQHQNIVHIGKGDLN